jgi:2-iminoacetate synthase
LCTPNAIATLKEYLVDYASPATRTLGERLIERELEKIPEGNRKQELRRRLAQIETTDDRDLYF